MGRNGRSRWAEIRTKLLAVGVDDGGALPTLDAHPLLREYFAREIRDGQPDAWRAAHRRLYEHLCKATVDKNEPTLEDLQPLCQAVAHGCLAGMQREASTDVYLNRIQRRHEYFITRKLGAFGSDLGAVACIFDLPWSRVSPSLAENAQQMLVAIAAVNLRALGRLSEVLEPMRADLAQRVRQENWDYAASAANNLCELVLTMGNVARAVQDAAQAVEYADRSGLPFQFVARRTTHADALH